MLVGMRGKKSDEASARLLADVPALLEYTTAQMRAVAQIEIDEEEWVRAVTLLHRLATEHAGMPGSEGCAELIDELAAREGLHDEIEAARLFAKADRLEREENWRRASGGYAALAKRYPDTQAGKLATERVAYLANKSG